jgi:hypothetical protein
MELTSGSVSKPIHICAYFALVSPEPPNFERRTRHTWGVPPNDRLLPWPAVIVLEETPTDAMLFRYSADGAFGGDTWHEDAEAARQQASFEYNGLLGEWTLIPDGEDAATYALRQVDT